MEKKILFICLIIISAFCIIQKINYNSQVRVFNKIQNRDKLLMDLKKCIELEDLCKGKVIGNIKVSDSEGKEDFLYNILSEYKAEYCLIIISSIEACSTCRDETLNIWNYLYKKNNKIPIFFIVSEQEELNKDDKRKIKANLKGLNIEIPFYFDDESILLNYLDITPYETPLSTILTHNKKIIAINKSSESTKQRIVDFKKFFLTINSYEE